LTSRDFQRYATKKGLGAYDQEIHRGLNSTGES